MRVENETGERTSLDVLVFVSDGDFPLARLVRLECGRVDTVIVDDRAVEDPIGGRLGLHRQGTSSGSVRIDLKFFKNIFGIFVKESSFKSFPCKFLCIFNLI